jgi:hypothetical protein
MTNIDLYCSDEQCIEINGKLRNVFILGKTNQECSGYNVFLTGDSLSSVNKINISNKFTKAELFVKFNEIFALLDEKYVHVMKLNDIGKIFCEEVKKDFYLNNGKFNISEQKINDDSLKEVVKAGGLYLNGAGKPFLYLGECTCLSTNKWEYPPPAKPKNIWVKSHLVVKLEKEDLLYSDEADIFTKNREGYKFDRINYQVTKPTNSRLVKFINAKKKIDKIVEEARFVMKRDFHEYKNNHWIQRIIETAANINSKRNPFLYTDIENLE